MKISAFLKMNSYEVSVEVSDHWWNAPLQIRRIDVFVNFFQEKSLVRS